jgi:hypothetical protein
MSRGNSYPDLKVVAIYIFDFQRVILKIAQKI